jgi:hypothetical protein
MMTSKGCSCSMWTHFLLFDVEIKRKQQGEIKQNGRGKKVLFIRIFSAAQHLLETSRQFDACNISNRVLILLSLVVVFGTNSGPIFIICNGAFDPRRRHHQFDIVIFDACKNKTLLLCFFRGGESLIFIFFRLFFIYLFELSPWQSDS